MKSFVGWLIEFELAVCFVPISIAEKGPHSVPIAAFSDSSSCSEKFNWDLPRSSGLHWGNEWLWSAEIMSGLMAKLRRGLKIVCI